MEVRILNADQLADLYRKAFDHVCDSKDWKGPIDCMVPLNVADIYEQAIEFMTGVKPVRIVTKDEGRDVAYLSCVGYRRGPCGG